MRCRSWRPVDAGQAHVSHLPGTDRQCWKPCRNTVEDEGFARCRECEEAISFHDSAAVRMALIDEGRVRMTNLHRLTDDSDISVSMNAEELMNRLYGTTV